MRKQIRTITKERCFRVRPLPVLSVIHGQQIFMIHIPLSENLAVRIKSQIRKPLVKVETIVLQTVIQKAWP
jgi:hypothetical protein